MSLQLDRLGYYSFLRSFHLNSFSPSHYRSGPIIDSYMFAEPLSQDPWPVLPQHPYLSYILSLGRVKHFRRPTFVIKRRIQGSLQVCVSLLARSYITDLYLRTFVKQLLKCNATNESDGEESKHKAILLLWVHLLQCWQLLSATEGRTTYFPKIGSQDCFQVLCYKKGSMIN